MSDELLPPEPQGDPPAEEQGAEASGAVVGSYERAQDKVIRRLSEQLEGDLHAFLSYRNRRRLVLAVAWI